MYKILIADDDNRTVESIERILEQFFDVTTNIKIAKTGRQAIELAETFCPDILFIELQIPGINGIEVMREIRNIHQNVNMVIVSSCAKFDYAKEAIGIGVLDYISKPFQEENMIKVLKEIFLKVDVEKKKRSLDLEIKEKKEIITPILENNLINSFLDGKIEKDEIDYFCTLLGMKETTGYFMVLQLEDFFYEPKRHHVTRTGVSLKKEYIEIKYVIKSYFQCYISAMRGNRIMVFVPQKQFPLEEEYEIRIQMIEKARKMVQELKRNFKTKCKVGIGGIYERYNLSVSYEEARSSLEYDTKASVVHVSDLPVLCDYAENYPMDIENQLLKSIEIGNLNESMYHMKRLFGWMINCYEKYVMDIKLKVLEFVLRAELIGFENGDMTQHFTSRGKYLEEIIEIQNFQQLQNWFEGKIVRVCRNVHMKKEENHIDIIKRAKQYIKLNYAKDIDLDEVSKYLQISPYYFSKLFKKKTGKNFIEYLTQVRMEHAKTLLKNSSKSMKEICMEIGYCDANYFSRIFKKNVGVSPTEYKEEKYGA